MIDLTVEEIKKLTDQLAALRVKILETGATVLSPTTEWDRLRKEIALLNKKLNADTVSKKKALDAAAAASAAET